MGKWSSVGFLDAGSDFLIANVTQATLCSAQPGNFNEAVTPGNKCLAIKAVDPVQESWIKTYGTNGRKLVVSQILNAEIVADGLGTHIALCSADALLYVTTCAETAVTIGNGNLINLGTFDIQVEYPE